MTANTEVRRLYKSRTDRMLDGICGGVAAFFGLDATLVRIAWVLLALLGGVGVLLYIVAMIIMPVNHGAEKPAEPAVPMHERNSKFWGILLVIVGIVWFLGNLGLPVWYHWWGLTWDVVLPVMLILAGVAFLFGGRNSLAATPPEGTAAPAAEGTVPPAQTVRSRLYKSRAERKISGVCSGLADYFGIDPTVVRLLFIIAAFVSFGFVFLLYVIMAIVMPREPAAA